MFYWGGGKENGSTPLWGGVIWGHNLYFQRLWAHSKPHLFPPTYSHRCREHKRSILATSPIGLVARIVFIIQQDLLTRGAGSLHQFSLYEYAYITAGIVGEDGNGFAEVA